MFTYLSQHFSWNWEGKFTQRKSVHIFMCILDVRYESCLRISQAYHAFFHLISAIARILNNSDTLVSCISHNRFITYRSKQFNQVKTLEYRLTNGWHLMSCDIPDIRLVDQMLFLVSNCLKSMAREEAVVVKLNILSIKHHRIFMVFSESFYSRRKYRLLKNLCEN